MYLHPQNLVRGGVQLTSERHQEMDRLTVHHPISMFVSNDEKKEAMASFASIVASALDCRSYNGRQLELRRGDIDVILVPYEDANVQFDTRLVVEIIGHDYPERMCDIRSRLVNINHQMSRLYGDVSVSVAFIGITDGCSV